MRNWIEKLTSTTIAISIALCSAIVVVILAVTQLRFQTTETPSNPEGVSNRSGHAIAVRPEELVDRWIVSPGEAKYLIEQGAVVLDARDRYLQVKGMVQGAIAVRWQQFSQPAGAQRGHLLHDEVLLTQKIREVGVFTRRAVVVVGDPLNGWGEDGRVVWMLRSLGHQQAVFVDGGYAALIKTGLPTTRWQFARTATRPGDFTIRRIGNWEITQTALRTALNTEKLVVIDARELREFAGETPYGERRGGHIPGAISLHFRELIDTEGKVLPREQILARFRDRNIPRDVMIVSYCTGGVRSAWLTAVLVSRGLQARNYAGSMWEWSASDASHYPLEP